MAEGAGAAGLAAMLAEPERFRGRKVGLILCGGNIDPRILASIMVRELERADRIVSFRLTIPDRPGRSGSDRDQARRTRRQYSRRRSSPAVSRRPRQGRQARRHRRDARRRPCRGNFSRARRRRLSAGADAGRDGVGVRPEGRMANSEWRIAGLTIRHSLFAIRHSHSPNSFAPALRNFCGSTASPSTRVS